jgi:ABC-type xylose transport system substrate-binding protein
MTYALPPDLVVILGLRTVLSIIGLTVLLAGFWMMEKQWDDQGSSMYEQAQQENATESDYKAVDDETESKEANDIEDHYTQAPDMVVIKQHGASRDLIQVATKDADEKSMSTPTEVAVDKPHRHL